MKNKVLLLYSAVTILLPNLTKAFDEIKNGWYINPNIGLENIYLEEKIFDNNQNKTISKDTSKLGILLNAEFGYIFKNNFLLGLGAYWASLGSKPELITNKTNNEYFDITESGSYFIIGYNFKEKHLIRLYGYAGVIFGEENFVKDSKEFTGEGFILKYSYEPVKHLLISPFIRSGYFINENEWSNKINIVSLGIEVGWIFY